MPSQEDIDKKLADYFARLDPLAAGILAEIEAVKRECSKWDELSQKQRDDLIDDHFIPHEVKSQYKKKNSLQKELGTVLLKLPAIQNRSSTQIFLRFFSPPILRLFCAP